MPQDLGSGYGNDVYKGTLRHENMTWVWIRDLAQCP